MGQFFNRIRGGRGQPAENSLRPGGRSWTRGFMVFFTRVFGDKNQEQAPPGPTVKLEIRPQSGMERRRGRSVQRPEGDMSRMEGGGPKRGQARTGAQGRLLGGGSSEKPARIFMVDKAQDQDPPGGSNARQHSQHQAGPGAIRR
ncbi:hypothetical protein HNY73_014670 [Argiope bruennichi]|uniref:Uncharacterized protein n=1 Tax=Argiope bruennichi TaxID=94029 RepID=A0A8T0EV33_ARGBR|nr:hypothetical protein HNY73_014670 [Argiope bruennichi]